MTAIKRLVLVLIIVVGVSCCVGFAAEVSSQSYVLLDIKTDQVLRSHMADERVYPASLTKLLTAWIVIHRCELEDVVTIDDEARSVEGTRAYLKVGEQYTVKELLHALLMASANDAAIALAKHVGGSIEQFAELMNEEARSLGAVNSHFTNPHGLHNDNHYTTASDFVLIANHIYEDRIIREICSKYKKVISDPSTDSHDRLIISTNALINQKSGYFYRNAVAGKTGYTSAAGQCLVVLANRNNRPLLLVLFHATGKKLWTDAHQLLDYGYNNYDVATLAQDGEVLGAIRIPLAETPVCFSLRESVNVLIERGEDDVQWTKRLVVGEDVKAPVRQADEIGYIEFTNGDRKVEAPIIATFPVEDNFRIRRLVETLALIAVGGIGTYLLVRRLIKRSSLRK